MYKKLLGPGVSDADPREKMALKRLVQGLLLAFVMSLTDVTPVLFDVGILLVQ